MKDPFSTTSTTSIVSVLALLCCFTLLFYIVIAHGDKETVLIQVITLIGTLLSGVGGYYWGASKQRAVTQTADTISNSPAVNNEGGEGQVTQTENK